MKRVFRIGLVFGFFCWAFGVDAARIRIEPSSATLVANCPTSVSLMIDTQWQETNTIWIALYDTSLFSFLSLDTVWGIFSWYTNPIRSYARYWERRGDALLSFLWTTAQKKWFIGSGLFATIGILPFSWSSSFDISFYHIPSTLADDTNVNAFSGLAIYDALAEAIGWSYIVVDWPCGTGEASSLVLSEEDPVILRTQDGEYFFFHELPFFKKVVKVVYQNKIYIIASLLFVFIMSFVILIFRKRLSA
jgi:hypothetical protein